ncbi:MAG TPA: hypothetical protein VMT51_01570 [Dongiaceae bacterium]|nr:hypothetical protein [Dongiaceae bacterium]
MKRPRPSRSLAVVAALLLALPSPAAAREPKPETLAAFRHYRELTEARMAADLAADHFFRIDALSPERRAAALLQLKNGEFYLEQLHTLEGGRNIPVPSGLIHHWVGVGFLPNTTLAETRAIIEDYDHEKENYFPDVRKSRLVSSDGHRQEVFLQLYSRTVVTAVFNVNFASETSELSPTRVQVRSCSTRVADVEDFGKPSERELPLNESRGYLWELCTWWHLEEKDGGTYMQVEAIELSRTVPIAFAWLVNPIIKNVPKTFLSRLLSETRTAVEKRRKSKSPATPSQAPAPATS